MKKIFPEKLAALLGILATAAFFQFGAFVLRVEAAGISSVSPDVIIPQETEITISGYGFGNFQNGQGIFFNNVQASSYTYWSDNQIRLLAPAISADGTAVIKLCSKSNSFAYTCNSLFWINLHRQPKIALISKTSGNIGDEISIYGSFFGDNQGVVTFNGVRAEITAWRNHWNYEKVIQAIVPANAQSGDIVVTSSNGYSSVASVKTKFSVTYPSLTASNSSGGTDYGGAGGSSLSGSQVNPPSTAAIFQNNGKVITNFLPVGSQYISEYPIVKFSWSGAFSNAGIAGYFVEFTDKTAVEPAKTGRYQATDGYQAYNFEPNKDYNLFIQAIDRNGNLSEIRGLTYQFRQDLETISKNLTDRMKGRILLQVESAGEAWYVNPADGKRIYLGRPADAFAAMRKLGMGISNADLKRIPVEGSQETGDAALVSRLRGKILLQVESAGEAWYVNPADGKRIYLGQPADAFRIMRQLGLGIADDNLNKILVGTI